MPKQVKFKTRTGEQVRFTAGKPGPKGTSAFARYIGKHLAKENRSVGEPNCAMQNLAKKYNKGR